MDKQAFIDHAVASARPQSTRERSMQTKEAYLAHIATVAAAQWDREHTPEFLARAAFVKKLVARGGKVWENKRVYFSLAHRPTKGFPFIDFYVDIDTRRVPPGAYSQSQLAIANEIAGL